MKRKRKKNRTGAGGTKPNGMGPSWGADDGPQPILTIDERKEESLFAVIDFMLPASPVVRRVMAKRTGDGKLEVVMYWGIVGPDNTCLQKRDVMRKKNETAEGFWKFVGAVETTYRSHGGSINIKSFDGKNINQAADLLEKTGSGKVWRPKPGEPIDFSKPSGG